MFVLKCIVKPDLFIYYKSPGVFTSDIINAYFFSDRNLAIQVLSCYTDFDLQLEKVGE